MALKQIGVTTGGTIKKFTCYTTDLVNGYPPKPDNAGPGSTCKVLDSTAKTLADIFEWDGTDWYKY
jgi:hypothetical protein